MMNDAGGDETALVIRGQSGDRAAFEELVRRTARWVFVRVYVEVSDTHRAEDLAQETFLRAWSKLGSLSDVRTFRGWLAAIAHAMVVDSVKHDQRKKRRGLSLAGFGNVQQAMLRIADTNQPSPIESAEKNEQREKVLAMLRTLPPDYRDVLMLRFLSGADYQQISKQLALTNGSLRGLLSRGMKMLREKMMT